MWIVKMENFIDKNTAIIEICILILSGIIIVSSTFLTMFGIISIPAYKIIGIIAAALPVILPLIEFILQILSFLSNSGKNTPTSTGGG